MNTFIKQFSAIGMSDVPEVGGKNASLGEMISGLKGKGIRVPDGFATTAAAFRYFLDVNQLTGQLEILLQTLNRQDYSNLAAIGAAIRNLILQATFPDDLKQAILSAYQTLSGSTPAAVAVRSSATAEDMPQASFAGQHESFLNIQGPTALIDAVHRCYASLYTDRAIKYREDNHFDHNKVALCAGVQQMVRSDLACSGVGFTLEPESGFRDVVLLTGIWGLGENIVQGTVVPDEFYVFKPTLQQGKQAIIQRKKGSKAQMLVYGATTATLNIPTPDYKQAQYVLSDEEITRLARWAVDIEQHYQCPMDIEWAKDGINGELYLIQARPETIHSREKPQHVTTYQLKDKGLRIVSGEAIGSQAISGTARVLASPTDAGRLNAGEIIVTTNTSPDWDPLLKKAAAIVTDSGGRTSHAAIVAREMGVPAITGTQHATTTIHDGQLITVSCCEGRTGFVYDGAIPIEKTTSDYSQVKMPQGTAAMLIISDPEKAFQLSLLPNDGVGLLRMEFIITRYINIHPMALVKYNVLKDQEAKEKIAALTADYGNKEQFFIDRLSEGIATIAAAFYPKDVIVRMSDFKTNEYRQLLGGKEFEPSEENPMLGFRGASRYYHPLYREGFALECAAIRRVRNEMGLTNVKVMIPFCRTVNEGRKVLQVMASCGLKQGEDALEVYVMAEIPSNVLEAEKFADIFDGFSIGSNDLTQLTLGIDRDSGLIANIFDEEDPAAMQMISMMLHNAKKAGARIGLCGQAPSDIPAFASFLVAHGIDSISFNPDALLKGIENIRNAEEKQSAGELPLPVLL
ncbi:phosphoenolpyruvate synthase [Chitinophaga polysaccharea]|uniref:Phosphoenolpyruvate synthase n=1 Tax=Chitinophaga polysaccharea TaxID=1293035 RepID=A0A561Q5S5_9BACT|nr:phosphoenolpyruvate synthase [Chitinophaga polysaccharea]TWF45711.1 phosphoenolpyruvate synthase [Chitinophaga polysaccharea]